LKKEMSGADNSLVVGLFLSRQGLCSWIVERCDNRTSLFRL
jgi:hypothetical protein